MRRRRPSKTSIILEEADLAAPLPVVSRKVTIKDAFQHRRETDPQGLIDDLLSQTRRQGLEIHRLNKELKQRVAV